MTIKRFAAISVSILIASFAGVLPQVNASPAPTPAPAPVDLGSIVDSATGAVATGFYDFTSAVYSPPSLVCRVFYYISVSFGGHAYSVITSEGGRAITLASDGAGVVTSFAGSIYTVATADVASAATNFATHVTSDHELLFTEIGGHAYTVITDGAAGDAFTLATGAAGDVTSIGGSLYTVATGSIPTGTANAGYINSPASIFPGTPVLASLLTMAGGVLVGAYVVF
ncbi:hypothetical protein FRC05_002395 [Tulasnella sp. 425]|nr:hypothetical protein FRC05_002395 [Tulasnella sp. 425]